MKTLYLYRISMFLLACNITIGPYTFTRCNGIRIEKSSELVANTAKITVPTSAVLQSSGATTAIETAKAISVGMPVTIQEAYDGVYAGVEFQGYIRRLNLKTPLEIECEDNTYTLRKKNINKSWTSTTLEDVVKYILSGSGIDIAGSVPQIDLAPFSIKNANGAFALQKIKDDFGLTVYFNEDGKLYIGLAYTDNTGTVKYILDGDNCNVIDPDDLKYHNKDDVVLKVKAIAVSGDNSRTAVELGDKDGELRTLYFYNVKDKDQLIKLAQQKLDKLKFDGYEGKLLTFLIPYAIPGMKAVVTDNRYPQRNGSYYVKSVLTTFGQGGARREVEIGIKLG